MGVSSKGEYHEIAESASEALLAGVSPTREIHLEQQCASECIVEGVRPKGEFHEIVQSASQALLAGVALTGEIHLAKRCASEGILMGVSLRGGHKVVPPQRTTCPRRHSEGGRP